MLIFTFYTFVMGSLFFSLYFLGFVSHHGLSLFIDGCPMFGCRPSGSFSFYLQVPKDNVSVNWVSNFVLDPVPRPLGCVSDSVSIVCPGNGPFSDEKGYFSLYTENGTIRWRDRKLHFPTLPLLDNFGDVTGSDGIKLIRYDADGKVYPAIPCDGLYPLFNMALVGDSFLLLVSEKGLIVVRETNGVPVGSLTLNATYGGVNGTYIPIVQPVINEMRFYLLTEFIELQDTHLNINNARNRRLYAIDVHQTISNRITVAWYKDFPYSVDLSDIAPHKGITYVKGNTIRQKMHLSEKFASGNASLLWNRYNKTIYLLTPTVNTSLRSYLLGVHDKGREGEVIFQSRLEVLQMAMFVSNHCERRAVCDPSGETGDRVTGPTLWAVTQSSEIHQVTNEGVSVRVINLKSLFNTSVAMTTKLALVRHSDSDNDVLLFGIKMSDKFNKPATYVVALDTTTDGILWKVPVPGNMIPFGQISGVSGKDMRAKDQIIVYAETPGKNAIIFSIH